MMYLVLASLSAAQARTAQEALRRDCIGLTQYWWDATLATDNVHGLIAIGTDDEGNQDEGGLTPAEIASLITSDQAITAGYLPPADTT